MTDRVGALPRSFLAYALLHVAAGAVLLKVTWAVQTPPLDYRLVFIAFAVLISEMGAVVLPGGGSASLSYPLLLAGTMLFGPSGGAAVALVSALDIRDLRLATRRPLPVALGNAGQLLVSYLAAAWAYVALGGPVLLAGSGGMTVGTFGANTPVALGAFAILFVGLNVTFTVFGISLLRGVPAGRVWKASFSWALAVHVLLGFLGVAIAQIVLIEPVAFLLFVFPLLIARQLYRRYMGLKDAYLDTVRSLVAAIEAKDPYTRGHSERVADYAGRLARASGMQDERLERLEFAALLHDLGKVGIRSSVLGKPGGLTHDEFDEIKQHPAIGAQILERVPYLEDIVPAVYSHHERFDGGGYGEGLTASQVPVEARILAVADSFDAMTSRRPYRRALSHAEAVRELRLHAGDQFDPILVDEFLRLMGEDVSAQISPSSLLVSKATEAVARDA